MKQVWTNWLKWNLSKTGEACLWVLIWSRKVQIRIWYLVKIWNVESSYWSLIQATELKSSKSLQELGSSVAWQLRSWRVGTKAAPERGPSKDSRWAPQRTFCTWPLQRLYSLLPATASEQWSLVARTAHSKERRWANQPNPFKLKHAKPQVCNGAVVKEIGKSLVKVCTDGKVKLKPRKQVGFSLVGFFGGIFSSRWPI